MAWEGGQVITYDDLRYCASLAREAEDAVERVERLRSMLERVTPMYKQTPGGHGAEQDKMASGVARLDEMEREAREKAEKYIAHMGFVEQAIAELPDDRHREILRLRYLDGRKWEEISEKTHYNERWCRKLHRLGIEELGVAHKQALESPVEKNI